MAWKGQITYSTIPDSMRTIAIIAALAIFSSGTSAQAGIMGFNVTSSFSLGTGYGTDASEKSGTLLDVRYAGVTEVFDLSLTGTSSHTYFFGTATMFEPNAHAGITSNETDNLSVTGIFNFFSPTIGNDSFAATVVGVSTGAVGDAATDYSVQFAADSSTFDFGNGGKFQLTFPAQTISLASIGDTKQFSATITLLAEPAELQLEAVSNPEPGSLIVWGLGMFAFGGMAWRKRRAAA